MTTENEPKLPGLPTIDVNEYGGKKDGERQAMNRRLFMQLLAFSAPAGVDPARIGEAAKGLLESKKVDGVVYADTMNPRGLALLTWSEDPAHFVRAVRPLFGEGPLATVEMRHDFGMIGRAY